jgi:hypothetical protein
MGFWADYLNKASATATPPAVSGYDGVYLGFGIVKYTAHVLAFAMTGSAQTLYFSIPRAHQLLQLRCSQFVTATGAADTTGLTLNLQKNDYYLNVGNIMAATNGVAAASTVVFDFNSGIGYSADAQQYRIGVTGQNNDELTVEFYVQYLTEPDDNVHYVGGAGTGVGL